MSHVPTVSMAAQSTTYVDPADKWIEANNRTNEFDINATVTTETVYCPNCDMETSHLTYRVPEYTKSGETALNRGVEYSDGTMLDGVSKGNVDGGTPGIDAYYTGYHWTKAVCQHCGVINTTNGKGDYSYGKNVYSLNSCDHNFFRDFNSTTYEPYNSRYHTTIEKEGEYCQYCKGTHATANTKRESHSFTETVEPQLGNQRFHLTGVCDDCGYIQDEYVVAKSVVESYYGKVDSDAHSITLSDLSESGVNTSIRYGTSASSITKTSAPSYTEEGYYPVYYEITYSYDGESMTEDGVSYVWLLADNSSTRVNSLNEHTHDYRYIDTVAPTCTDMGYELWQCSICGGLEKKNYKAPTGHHYDEVVIREASCTQGGYVLHICSDCGDHYTDTTPITDHNYESKVVAPTCTQIGYTEYICSDCGHRYITDLTPIVAHQYEATVTEPHCTTKGFTTYTCAACGDTYVSDYTEPTGHEWDEGHIVSNSTCESEGVIQYNCLHCDETMLKAISAKGHTAGAPATCTEPQTCTECGAILEMPTGHHYHTTVFEPSCTTLGYTVYECDDCDHSYIADYVEKKDHDYKATVTAPTCTAMGYTTYTCKDCGDTFVSDYTDKLPHAYTAAVTAPTCEEMGYTTYTCDDCGDTYVSDYTDALGHKPSDWIIDTPATIEHSGEKHTECERCGEILNTVTLPQLVAQDNSDEDGKSTVGDYFIILTDKDGKPIFDSEIAIDTADNITIRLPEGRLLDYADRTTISVFRTDTKDAVSGLNIFIGDKNNNAATGTTDDNGQLTVPNNQSSTGDDNGTIGGNKGDGETEKPFTYVVTVTDKNDYIIPNCTVYIGEDNDIVVKLPDGTVMDAANRITVTVNDAEGNAQQNVNVIVIGDNDYIEKGATNANGQITVPTKNQAYTDKKGIANVDGYIVTVTDETEPIYNALVTVTDDEILVSLPDGKKIDYHNRTTVTVKTSDGQPVSDMPVNVYDNAGGDRTENTDANGIVTIPPLNENIIEEATPTPAPTAKPGVDPADEPTTTDKPQETGLPTETQQPTATDAPTPTIVPDTGSEVIAHDYTYKVSVRNNDGNINGAIVSVDKESGKVTVKLPDGKTITPDNRIIVGVADTDGKPVSGVDVTVIAKDGTQANDKTNSDGIAIVPPTNTDRTDKDGYAKVVEGDKTYNVVVNDETEKIENAVVTVNDGKLSVTLPNGKKLVSTNQTTVTVTDADGNAVSGLSVTVTDTDNQTATKSTDANGKITVPAKASTSGGGGGSSSGGSRSGGGGGGSSSTTVSYNITVTDKDGKPVTVTKSIGKDGNVTLTLPNGRLIDDGYYTIVIKDTKGNAKADVDVTLKDKKNGEMTGTTDKNGTVVIPTQVHNAYVYGYEDGEFKPEGNMTRAEAAAIFARNIAERKGETIPSKKSSFKDVNSKLWYSSPIAYLENYDVISGYSDGTFAPETEITRAEFVAMVTRFYELFDKTATQSKNSFADVATTHWAYKYINTASAMDWIAGYADSTFRPDNSITRAEVVAIVNRVTGRSADAEYINKNMSAVNVFTDLIDKSYWAFYEILEAANTHSVVMGDKDEIWVR